MNEPMDKELPKKLESPAKFKGAWKLWLGVAILIAWIVLAQIERNSPSAEMHRQRALNNVGNIVYSDSMESCDAATRPAECKAQAEYDAQKARERLGPMLGR